MSASFLIHHALVLTGTDLTPSEDCSVLVANGQISWIGKQDDRPSLPADLDIVDATGLTLMPGLIDCHNHLSLDCSLERYLERMNGSEAELTVIATKTLVRDLKSGVTTARCMGDRFYIDVFCRKAVLDGFLQGPRLKVSGIGMRASHGHGFVGMPFDGEQALRQAVRANLKQGVDWIKFYSTGTAVQPDGQILSYYSVPEITAVIEEAHRAGVPVTSHCIGGPALHQCLEAGIDCIEHAYYADETHLEVIAAHGVMICLTPSEYFTDKTHMPEKTRNLFHRHRPTVHRSMELIARSGIPFVLGTDGMHGALAMEAAYAVSFGADSRSVLQALTSRAARFLGLGSETGSIEVGKQADLLLVDGNPLTDIASLKRVRLVYQKGIPIHS
jgi:imidazolonepropionase-like amidohydrolase